MTLLPPTTTQETRFLQNFTKMKDKIHSNQNQTTSDISHPQIQQITHPGTFIMTPPSPNFAHGHLP